MTNATPPPSSRSPIRSPRYRELTPAQRVFLAAYISSAGNASQAARSLGRDPRAVLARHYHWRTKAGNRDAYCECYIEATEIAVDSLVDEATRRAVEGVKDYVLKDGEVVWIQVGEDGELYDPRYRPAPEGMAVRSVPLAKIKYSDSLLQFLITKRSDRFTDKSKLELSGGVNVNAQVQVYLPDNRRGDGPPANGPPARNGKPVAATPATVASTNGNGHHTSGNGHAGSNGRGGNGHAH